MTIFITFIIKMHVFSIGICLALASIITIYHGFLKPLHLLVLAYHARVLHKVIVNSEYSLQGKEQRSFKFVLFSLNEVLRAPKQ